MRLFRIFTSLELRMRVLLLKWTQFRQRWLSCRFRLIILFDIFLTIHISTYWAYSLALKVHLIPFRKAHWFNIQISFWCIRVSSICIENEDLQLFVYFSRFKSFSKHMSQYFKWCFNTSKHIDSAVSCF